MFDRLNLLIDSNKLKDKTVLIVGVGGVGGYVVESLTRSNIGKLIIVDFDTVDISNINRQIIATTDSINKHKVDLFDSRCKSINPDIEIVKYKEFLDESNYLDILNNKVDFIVDACDKIKSKELIIKYALDNNIPFISSMGTGNRLDPSKILITTLDKTSNDPLAKILRKWTKDNNINSKMIKVLISNELPIKTHERTPGSTAFVPSSAGLLIGSYIVKHFMEENNEIK